MPRDTGLPQRLDRAMLIESAARQIEAHRSGQGQVVRNQPAFQGQRNWRRGLNQDPFRCSYCRGNNTLRSFATLYAQGSSLSKYRKGLILKTGWSETRKQSVLAMQCAPPRKKPLWWRVLLLIAAAAGALLLTRVQLIPSVATNVELTLAGAALLGVFVVLDGLRWNRFTYPRRMDTWSSSYFCVRCSRVTILRPVAD
ncbi:MAG TPA: hypothetical protein VN828_14265 [Acidobacteriaceae bacterium]|nr:hypothetical protein [Acidobacteriaceae bacterium]